MFAKLTQTGTYGVTAVRSGANGIGAYTWEVRVGYNEISARFIDKAGTTGQSGNVTLLHSKISATSYLLKVVCTNPNIGVSPNSLAITVTPLHATDNDDFVVRNPTDTPTTWLDVPNVTIEDKIAALETRIAALENV